MAKKLWSGRYSKATDSMVDRYSESVSFDCRLAPYDIAGSVAHAKMLAKCGIISSQEKDQIVRGLREILKEIEAGTFVFDPALEDVHMNVEGALTKRIGPAGEKLHTARSRNDQVALDTRLYLREQVAVIIGLIAELQKAMLKLAEKHKGSIIPGYTHMQHAQPVLFAHHMLAYIEMFERDKARLTESLPRINVLPLGSCALAGTGLPIDRQAVAKELGFAAVSRNSMDAVADRDFVLEFLGSAAIIGMHLSRLSEELILWAGTEFKMIDIDESFCTGSSIMPQKKNPDVAELTRGKTGRLYGNLVSVLVMMKGLPLAYNRDMQEDKEPLFDSVDTVAGALSVMAAMVAHVEVKEHKRIRFDGDFSYATDLAEYLVAKGVPFRKAHAIVGRLVGDCAGKAVEIYHLDLQTLKSYAPEFEKDVHAICDIDSCVRAKKSFGGTAPANVEKELRAWKTKLGSKA
ncbi:MAG TPA: argininosuccinate lyase [bacterium]|nr:argininosuccinate lyase [bacterium]